MAVRSPAMALFAGLALVPAANAACLSVEEAVSLARNVSPQVASANYTVDQGEAVFDGVKAQQRPQVSGFVRSGLGDGLLQSAQLDNQYGVELSYKLFDFGRAKFKKKSAIADIEASEANVARVEEAVSGRLLEALIELRMARTLIGLYEARLELLATRLETADKQLEQNTITLMDHSRLHSEAATTRYELTDVRARSRSAGLAVESLLRDPAACVTTDDLQVYLLARKSETIEVLVSDVNAHPRLLELEKRITAADYQRRSLSREWLPEISASAYSSQVYNDALDQFQDRDRVGIQIAAPLYDGGVRSSEVGRMRARVNQLEAEYVAMEDQLKAQKLTSWSRYHLLEDSLSALDRAVESANAHIQATRTRYDMRAGTVDDLLEAEQRLMNLQIRYQYVQAQHMAMLIDLARPDSLD